MPSPAGYILKPAVVAPLALSAVAIYLAVSQSPWWLLGLPFSILGTVCGQPNLNAADGCLAYTSSMIGYALSFVHRPSGLAIMIFSLMGIILGSIEKRIFAKPFFETDETDKSTDSQ
jgi:hypothetical protein